MLMNRLAGYLLMVIAVGHTLVGIVLYRESLAAIFRAGFFNTVLIDVNYSCRSATTGIAGRCQVDGLPRRRCGRSEWEKAACVRG